MEKWQRAAHKFTLPQSGLRRLRHFERLTYVPASDTSRLSGAGAGLTDKD